MPRYAKDVLHDGIELYYDGKPGENTIGRLKEHGWKWNPKKNCWYASNTEENVKFATKECTKKTASLFSAKKQNAKPLKNECKDQTPNDTKPEKIDLAIDEKVQNCDSAQAEPNNQSDLQNCLTNNLKQAYKPKKESEQTQDLKADKPAEKKASKVIKNTETSLTVAKKEEKNTPTEAKKLEVTEKTVEFAQNTPAGVTIIKITKGQNNAFRISSKNGLIMCADCKKHISIRSPKCIYCGTSLGRTLEVYFNLQHKKKDAEEAKQSEKDQELFKKQSVDSFEEKHEIFFNREHRKYLMNLNLNDFKTVVKRSNLIFENKDVLPYFSQDAWMRLMRLSDDDFAKEFEKNKKC